MKPAENLAGVHAVLSSHSPDAKLDWYYTLTVKNRLFPNLCRYEGEVVAAVAAETPHQAHDALRAIVVDYEVLPHTVTTEQGMKPGAPRVDPKRDPVSWGRGGPTGNPKARAAMILA